MATGACKISLHAHVTTRAVADDEKSGNRLQYVHLTMGTSVPVPQSQEVAVTAQHHRYSRIPHFTVTISVDQFSAVSLVAFTSLSHK